MYSSVLKCTHICISYIFVCHIVILYAKPLFLARIVTLGKIKTNGEKIRPIRPGKRAAAFFYVILSINQSSSIIGLEKN